MCDKPNAANRSPEGGLHQSRGMEELLQPLLDSRIRGNPRATLRKIVAGFLREENSFLNHCIGVDEEGICI